MILNLIMLRLSIRNVEGWRYLFYMSRYSCKCPAPGCDFILEVTANDWEGAFKKSLREGGLHIMENHPDFPDFEDREGKAREYALENLKKI